MARRVPFKFGQCEPTSETGHGGAIRRRAAQISTPSLELEPASGEVATGFETVWAHRGRQQEVLVFAGVVAPRGSAGHSCVAQMDGFRVNSDLACLSDDREAIAELRALAYGATRNVVGISAARSAAICNLKLPDHAARSIG
jgi:hypothetical protein